MAGTIRGRVRSRSSKRASTRKLAATFWKMNEMPLSEVMEKKLLRSEHSSVVLSASVSHSDQAPGGSVSRRMDRFMSRSHQRTPSESPRSKHLEPTVRVVDDMDQRSVASSIETEISYRARTAREPIVGVRTRLKDVNNALVTSKELLKIINRNLAHNDQLGSCMSLVSALHSELERACQQVNQLIKEQPSDRRETRHLVKCLAEKRASYDQKQQAAEIAIDSIAGELEAERKLRGQYESLNNKLGRELTETKIKLSNTIKELESDKKARKRTEQECHKIASDISQEEFDREREILQLPGKKVHTKVLECKDHFDEKNGVVEKLRNQFEAFFKSNKSEKTSRDKITTYSSRTHSRSNKNEDKEYDGEVGNSSAESDLHSIELNMDSKRGSFKWTHASTATKDSLSTDDEVRARKYISETVQNKNSYIQGSVSDGFQRGIRTQNTPSSVNLLQQERRYRPDKKSQKKGDKCELLRNKSVKDLKDKILSSYSLRSGGESSSPIQEWAHPQYFGHVIKQVPRSKQRLRTKSRLGEIGAEGQKQRRISRHFVE